MKNKVKLAPVFFACLALTGCQVLTSAENIEKAVAPSPQKSGSRVTFEGLRAKDPQSKIGAKEHPKILAANGGAYQNQKLETLLALIVGRLVAQSNDAGRAYDITILNSSTVNAFALPGGYLYVTRGLIALANDASEVAAVLAHEMAHVSSNHGVKRSNQTKVVNIADRVVNDVVSNPVVGQVVKASTEQRLAKFSKRQELQADAIGIKMTGNAGYDAFAASRFLKSMGRYAAWRSALNAAENDMSNSHPSTPRRIELAQRHARLLGPRGTGKKNRKRFLKGIDGIQFSGSSKEGYIRGQVFYHGKLGIRFQVPPRYELTNKSAAVLASGPNQVALRFDAVSQKGLGSNSVGYLKSGWVNGLITSSVTPTTINGMAAATAKAQTGDWQFSITVIDFNKRFYRFILAAPRANSDIQAVGQSIAKSFRTITSAERTALKPLVLQIVTVKQTDTIASLAARMSGVSRKVELFRALNSLSNGSQLKVGAKVKLVVGG